MRRPASIVILALLILSLASLGLAMGPMPGGNPGGMPGGNPGTMPGPGTHQKQMSKIQAMPFMVDPTASGLMSAAWVSHQGLLDAGKSNHALMLEIGAGAPVGAQAGAAFKGVKGASLTALGVSMRQDSLLSANAPRFVVKLANGDTFLFPFASGASTPAGTDPQGNAWNAVTFTDANAVPMTPAAVWPGFGQAVVDSMNIIVDEVGTAWLDNIKVNNIIIKKPGMAHK